MVYHRQTQALPNPTQNMCPGVSTTGEAIIPGLTETPGTERAALVGHRAGRAFRVDCGLTWRLRRHLPRPDWASSPAKMSRAHGRAFQVDLRVQRDMENTLNPTTRTNVTHIDDGCMVQLDPTRKTGFLNQKNREFILDEWDSSGNSARQRRYRIRQQFVGGLRDLFYLSLLPEDDRDRIFSEVKEERELSDSGHNLLATIFQELYSGLGRVVFEVALENGVEAAIVESRVDEEGIYPDVEPRLEIEEGDFGDFDVEEILSRIREEDGWLHVDREHVERLYDAGIISYDKFSALRDQTHRVLSDEEQRLFHLKQEEKEMEAARIWRKRKWSVNDVLFLREYDYLTDKEADAILNGGEDRHGFRYAAHCLRCAYESDDWDKHLHGRGLLPDSAADITIRSWSIIDRLSEWHKKVKGNPEKQLAEANRPGDVVGPDAQVCLNFEGKEVPSELRNFDTETIPQDLQEELSDLASEYESDCESDSVPRVKGETRQINLPIANFEPKYDPKEFPSPEELTPTHIEVLYENGLILEDQYHNLLKNCLEMAPNLITDEQARSLFAAGEIGINEVRRALDPEEIDEEYIVDIYEKERIDRKQYLDMLEMKYHFRPGSISREHLVELVNEERVDPSEAPPAAHFHLLRAEIHTPEEFLDGLEAAYEHSPKKFKQDGLLELYDADRITVEEVVEHPNTNFSDPEHVRDGRPVTEMYPEDWGSE